MLLARVSAFTSDGVEDPSVSITQIRYSNIAILTLIILCTVVVLLGVLNGYRRLISGMPLVGSCSAAISAACRRPTEGVDAAKGSLMWGVVEGEGDIGHCCFTSFRVKKQLVGRLYAGMNAERRLIY